MIPTAVLSTHTAFQEFTFHDLTDEIHPIQEHWLKEKFKFDGIYTGYLGSFKQIELVSDFFDKFKTENNFIFIDPVMGDYGKLYKGFDEKFALKMAELCKKADIIVPNLTESSYMLNIEYKEEYNEEYIKEVLIKLSELGPSKVMLTGVSLEEGQVGVMAYDAKRQEFFSYYREKIPVKYHGTGDLFASTCAGLIAKGKSFEKSIQIAVDYVVESIKSTVAEENGNWYGVNFEENISMLIDKK